MWRAGDELENSVTGERSVVRLGSEDTGGEYMVADLFARPGARVALPHVHPGMTETFEVLEGHLGVIVGDRRLTAGRGEKVTVPPGTVHDWWNGEDSEAHVLVEVRGPGVPRGEMAIETLWGLAREGKTNNKGNPNPLQMAVIAREFSDVFRPAKPPPIVQKVVLAILAPIGRALGYKPTYDKYSLRRKRATPD
jgi:quercetin dioxygenase-like cupin family protein